LSSAAPDCPVPHEDKAPTVKTVRTLTVGCHGWRTGLFGAPIDSSLPQRLNWWLGAINTPQPPPLQPSKHSIPLIQYKSNRLHSKTQIKATDPIKSPQFSSSVLGLEKGSFLCFFVALIAWLAFLFLSFLLSKPCNRSKRHQLCGGPCRV
jgi:hypothetical protein